MKIKVKAIIDEDFSNYKKPSMLIAFPSCTFKCERESGIACCHNNELWQAPNIEIEATEIVERYMRNPITSALVCGGLEPFNSCEDLLWLISRFRQKTQDDVVIYTGFNKNEDFAVNTTIRDLQFYKNIIIKYGRYIPNRKGRFDDLLGVQLASDNQFAERIS